MKSLDPVSLSKDLIARPSITPQNNGALEVLENVLKPLGFVCTRLPFGDVDNLYAQYDGPDAADADGAPHFCFAGHTDVVPPGDETDWQVPPFDPKVENGELWGRGAADMKGAIGAFVAAAAAAIEAGHVRGRLSLLITGDEEGEAINGTRKMLDWVRDNNIKIDHCLVGEPSNPDAMGDMIKVGRRGSINCWLDVTGVQGHVAYPHRAQNPIPPLVELLTALTSDAPDDGYERFQPSSLQLTDVFTGNSATNVIPQKASARFNIRFNPNWTGESIEQWIRQTLDSVSLPQGASYALKSVVSGEAFLTTDTEFLELLQDTVREKTGRTPELSTSGGTSDARFIKDIAPVAEFGLVGATMHKVNERVAVSDIEMLTGIYERVLERYYSAFAKG